MTIRKTSTGTVTTTEGPVTKTAAAGEPWTEQDDEELAQENDAADGGQE